MENNTIKSTSSSEPLQPPDVLDANPHAKTYYPRPFKEIPLLWLKIFKMDAAFFENEIQHTSLRNSILSIFLYSTIFFLLGYSLSYINSIVLPIADHPINKLSFGNQAGNTSILLSTFIGIPICFLVGNGVMFLIAKLFKGKGKFTEQLYIDAIYIPMIKLIETIASFFQHTFPVIYWIILIPFFIFVFYAAVLGVRSYRIVHKFSAGKAFGIIIGTAFAYLFINALILTIQQHQ